MRLAVVGFGLIGGSVAAAHRERMPGAEVVAIDEASVLRDPSVVALSDRQVELADAAGELRDADLVLLAAPVRAIEDAIEGALAEARLVTDCGSTKRSIVARASRSPRRGRFVPGHPLAGGSSTGAAAARADLFVGQTWILCREGSDEDAFEAVRSFVTGLGARPVELSASEHDRALALTSHVPQLLASALLVLSERRGATSAEGPGFASATRVAGGNPSVWGDIFATNADEVAVALAELGAELERIRADLARGDTESARALLELARRSSAARRSAR